MKTIKDKTGISLRGIQGSTRNSGLGMFSDEKGIALVMVLVLSAITLAIMAGLIYMVTSGTQMSGMQKRYKTALESGLGGVDVTYELIGERGDSLDPALTAALSLGITTPVTCVTLATDLSCTVIGSYTGLATKLNQSTSCWSGCDDSLTIDPATPTSYDMQFSLGTAPFQYDVYSKIVDTVRGNSSPDQGLIITGVLNPGAILIMNVPYFYTIEIDVQNSTNLAERSKLSILYQY